MQSRWWDFGGDTIIRTDKYIRLASDKPSRDGWIFSRVPLTATNWEVRSDHMETKTQELTRVD
jgi:mannose-binding lectin 2